MYLFYVMIAFLIAFLLELIIIPKVLVISYKKKLFDEPDERKQHIDSTPRLGGITFLPIILFALCITITISLYIDSSMSILDIRDIGFKKLFTEFASLFSCLVLLYFVGIMDDLVGVRYRAKFAVQILCGIILVFSGVWINDFNGLLGFNEISKWIGYPLTVFLVVYILNSINLIDGIDGLASGLSIIAFAVLTYCYFLKDYLLFSLLSIAALGCLFPFFHYNVFGRGQIRKRKIFMGDTGSLAIGMILAYLLIRYTMANPCELYQPPTYPNPLIIFSVVLVPCLDVLNVVIYRIRKGNNPFKPDRNHLHHNLMEIGLSPRKSLIVILLMSVLFIALNFLLVQYTKIKWIFLIDIVLYSSIYVWLSRKRMKTAKG